MISSWIGSRKKAFGPSKQARMDGRAGVFTALWPAGRNTCKPLRGERQGLRSAQAGPIEAGNLWCRAALLVWVCAALSLAFIGCGERIHDSKTARGQTPEPVAALRTLESTLRLPADIDEMPFYPELASNARGDTVAVWEQFDGEHYNIWANSRPAGQDWGRASLIGANRSGHSYNPQLALNAYGSAMAVWIHADRESGSRTVWSSHLEIATGWGEAVQVDGLADSLALTPQVSIDERGHATAAWHQPEDSPRTVHANRYRPGLGWGRASSARLDAFANPGK